MTWLKVRLSGAWPRLKRSNTSSFLHHRATDLIRIDRGELNVLLVDSISVNRCNGPMRNPAVTALASYCDTQYNETVNIGSQSIWK